MSRCRFIGVLASLLLFLGTRPVRGEDKPVRLDAALKHAAYKALRTKIEQQSYRLDPKQVESLVETQFKTLGKNGPHKNPKPDDLKMLYLKEFDAQFATLVQQSADGLADVSTDKREALLKWLTTIAEDTTEKTKLKNEAQLRYINYIDKNLPAILGKSIEGLVTRQHEKLQAILKEQLATEPAPENIQRAAINENDRKTLIAAVSKSVLRQEAAPRQTLLKEATDKLDADIAAVVAVGIRHLQEQRGILTAKPESRSPAGIAVETATRLRGQLERQRRETESQPLTRYFGTFPAVATELVSDAVRHFDDLLKTDLDRIFQEVTLKKRDFFTIHRADAREAIGNDRAAHSEPGQSMNQFRETVFPQWIAADRTKIADAWCEALKQSTSQFDDKSESSVTELKRQIDARLGDDKSPATKSWNALQTLLIRNDVELVKDVRQEMAVVQARVHSPQLFDGWTPDEQALTQTNASRLTRAALRKLPIKWARSLPSDESQVLDETWTLLLERASSALRLGTAAIAEQGRLVDTQKGTMAQKIHSDRTTSRAQWIDIFTQTVESAWQRTSLDGDAVKRYPKLFARTREQIEGLVRLYYEENAAEQVQVDLASNMSTQNGVKQAIANEGKSGKTPVFGPHYDAFQSQVWKGWQHWLKEHAEWSAENPEIASRESLLKKPDEIIRGFVQKEIAAEIRRMKDERQEVLRQAKEKAAEAQRQNTQKNENQPTPPSQDGADGQPHAGENAADRSPAQANLTAGRGSDQTPDTPESNPSGRLDSGSASAAAPPIAGEGNGNVDAPASEQAGQDDGKKGGGSDLGSAADEGSGSEGGGSGEGGWMSLMDGVFIASFLILLLGLLILIACWCWNIKYLRQYVAVRTIVSRLNLSPQQVEELLTVFENVLAHHKFERTMVELKKLAPSPGPHPRKSKVGPPP